MPWHFLYALHNLVLPESPQAGSPGEWPDGIHLGSPSIVIVPGSDDRVVELRRSNPELDRFLGAFRDELGNSYVPAVMIGSDDSPADVLGNASALVAFRNAFALSVLLKGRIAAARGFGGMTPTWSDTFQFHPAQLTSSGRMVLYSPALKSLIATTKPLTFTPAPHVSREGRRLWPDMYLYRSLGSEWSRKFLDKQDDQFNRSLFRSLEVAFTACAVGAMNEESINDYGIQVALWVSALEILAWPTAKHANFDQVIALLNKAHLHDALRQRNYSVKFRKKDKPRRLNAFERAYAYLYKARNQFLHGNPATHATLMTKGRKATAPIPRLAAVVYRAALSAYLDERYPIKVNSLEEASRRADEFMDRHTQDEALAQMFGVGLE